MGTVTTTVEVGDLQLTGVALHNESFLIPIHCAEIAFIQGLPAHIGLMARLQANCARRVRS